MPIGSPRTPDAFDYTAGGTSGGTMTRAAYMSQGPVTLSKGSVLGIMQLKQDLQQLAARFGKKNGFKEPLMRCVEQVLIPSIRKNFSAEGRPEMWEPIDTGNAYRRERKAGSAPILQPTGGMRRTAEAKARFSVKDNILEYGNWPTGSAHKASRYGYIHDMGGTTPFGEIPARPFAIYQREDIDDITKVFAKWAQEMAEKELKRHYGGF